MSSVKESELRSRRRSEAVRSGAMWMAGVVVGGAVCWAFGDGVMVCGGEASWKAGCTCWEVGGEEVNRGDR